ncbi:MAG: large-conductance mechanosensitive channel protein MscL [Clostridium sp.]|uniref:large-conductance mechanosensitive channel protein MscL n=1 Tax=Clostridium sp. TaxID=1506 RepID=UPI00291569AD|nr:large-conductance mechanosensitive channel protein MscL [Clostridium sp.]MDU7336516.1 large-conductance mechanosensitive channel protein MscL [Clostridium sp.]
MLKQEEQHVKKFVQEFKEFAMRGNVIDLAVGVIIGGAFGKITTSLVTDIITPVLSAITGKINLSELSLIIPAAFGGKDIKIAFGLFVQNILDFLITALVIFVMIKLMNRLRTKKDEDTAAEPEVPVLSKEEELLTEIRDLLKENKQE